MENNGILEIEEDLGMSMLSFVFFGFLSVVALVGCVRTGKLVIRAINSLFDRIEDKLGC
jgi:hypothetical protein